MKSLKLHKLYKHSTIVNSTAFYIIEELKTQWPTLLLNEKEILITHGNWREDNLEIEDFIVCLSDKIWKGKRDIELDNCIVNKISEMTKINFWDVSTKLELILEKIVIGSDKRIAWQGF
ncbi:hypothetical protein [Pontimicrobium sp. MEBiC01747]